MAIIVVDEFEAVDIHQRKVAILVGGARALQKTLKIGFEITAIPDTSKRILK